MENGLIQFGESHKENGMTSLDVAKVTKKRHSDVLRDIRNLLEQGVSERNFALTSYKQKQPRGGFKDVPMYELTPKGCLILASGYDVVLRERIIDKLEEYREREKNEEISEKLKQQSIIDEKMKVVSWVTDYLRLNDVSRLALAKETVEPFGITLPDYVTSKGVYHSASFLLKQNGSDISPNAFNVLAQSNGILEQKTRPSRKGEKRFLVITDKGLYFGENGINPHNQKETQPNWYDDKFRELLKLLGIKTQQSIF